jgi:hypothetical protein
MSRGQFLLILTLACGLLLAGSLQYQPLPLVAIRGEAPRLSPPEPLPVEARPLPPALAHATASAVLQQALKRYGPDQVAWLETTVRQQAMYEDVIYHAEGRCLSAPDHRLRLELQLQTNAASGRLDMICDGRFLTEILHLNGTLQSRQSTELPQPQQPTGDTAALMRQRTRFLQEKACAGLWPLLESLSEQLQQPQLRAVQWQEQTLLEIRGNWPVSAANSSEGRVQPRECRLFLDVETFWPRRVEWWGSASERQDNTLLFFTEYGQPVLNQPLPPERLSALFTPPA